MKWLNKKPSCNKILAHCSVRVYWISATVWNVCLLSVGIKNHLIFCNSKWEILERKMFGYTLYALYNNIKMWIVDSDYFDLWSFSGSEAKKDDLYVRKESQVAWGEAGEMFLLICSMEQVILSLFGVSQDIFPISMKFFEILEMWWWLHNDLRTAWSVSLISSFVLSFYITRTRLLWLSFNLFVRTFQREKNKGNVKVYLPQVLFIIGAHTVAAWHLLESCFFLSHPLNLSFLRVRNGIYFRRNSKVP